MLEQCQFDVKSADSIYVFGHDLGRELKAGSFELSSIPELAIGLFRKNIPLIARLNLNIQNPGNKAIEISQFEYIIAYKGKEFVNGTSERRMIIKSGQTTVVPITLSTNIYSILSDKDTRNEIFSYLKGTRTRDVGQKKSISIKIRPSIRVGKKLIKYPGYITIDKELSI